MKRAKTINFLILGAFAALVLSGCSYPISSHFRDQAQDITIPMVVNNPEQYKGDIVIWGGKIIKTRLLKTGTQVVIMHMPLTYTGKPKDNQTSQGRFIATTKDFLDPELYSAGKLVTVAGPVNGTESHPVGETEYLYPVVNIMEIHLFKPETRNVYMDPWYGWGPDGTMGRSMVRTTIFILKDIKILTVKMRLKKEKTVTTGINRDDISF